MNGSGLIDVLSDFFVSISNQTTFPIFSFISAGIVNVFVPSGGGQWGVQGPIIIKAALDIGVELPKSIMALSYKDQLTNMLQPFWALPLLGITGLKQKKFYPTPFINVRWKFYLLVFYYYFKYEKRKIQNFIKTLEPGILFASTAIGVSHLVQSTRAGNKLWLFIDSFYSCSKHF